MEGFSFVTHVTGLNRPNTGKEEDDDDMSYYLINVALFPSHQDSFPFPRI
jgi:hypothetical protein